MSCWSRVLTTHSSRYSGPQTLRPFSTFLLLAPTTPYPALGSTVALWRCPCRNPGACEHVPLHGKRDFADVIEVRILRRGDYPRLLKWFQYNTRIKGRQGRCEVGRRWSDMLWRWRKGPQAREPRQPLGAGRGQGTDSHTVPPEGRGLTASGLQRPETLFRPLTFRPLRKQICVKSVNLCWFVVQAIGNECKHHSKLCWFYFQNTAKIDHFPIVPLASWVKPAPSLAWIGSKACLLFSLSTGPPAFSTL